jgi:hypothetical protein
MFYSLLPRVPLGRNWLRSTSESRRLAFKPQLYWFWFLMFRPIHDWLPWIVERTLCLMCYFITSTLPLYPEDPEVTLLLSDYIHTSETFRDSAFYLMKRLNMG